MADNLTRAQRSAAMRRVKSKNTTPERFVRALLQRLGFTGYRLHRSEIPGKPDVAWLARRHAIFVHGCFWHGHNCARGARLPKTRRAYWQIKIKRNYQRDIEHAKACKAAGWRILVLWECELSNANCICGKLNRFLEKEFKRQHS